MPCCAFAACIVGQLILGFVAVKRALLGGASGAAAAQNAVVLWRLDSPAAPAPAPAPRRAWRGARRRVRNLALVAALEVLLILGAVYGVREHLGRGAGAGHAAHVHAAPGGASAARE